MLLASSLCYGLLLSPPLARRPLATSRPVQMCSDDVARSFAEELRRREASDAQRPANKPANEPSNEPMPFDGVREVVLDREGNPMSIPKRRPPPPASSMADDVEAIVTSPLFALGVLLSLGSAALLFAISLADAGA